LDAAAAAGLTEVVDAIIATGRSSKNKQT